VLCAEDPLKVDEQWFVDRGRLILISSPAMRYREMVAGSECAGVIGREETFGVGEGALGSRESSLARLSSVEVIACAIEQIDEALSGPARPRWYVGERKGVWEQLLTQWPVGRQFDLVRKHVVDGAERPHGIGQIVTDVAVVADRLLQQAMDTDGHLVDDDEAEARERVECVDQTLSPRAVSSISTAASDLGIASGPR
jgi:hypothetical protein